MIDDAPHLADLRRAARLFSKFTRTDTTWLRFTDATGAAPDLSRADHRELLLRLLSAFGCRIRYPREGETAGFHAAVSDWWQSWQPALPQASLPHLADSAIDAVAAAFTELAAVPVSGPGQRRRSLGPDTATKVLYALRPQSVVPWDAAIAAGTQGGRDGAAFGRHLRLCRTWAAELLAETGASEAELPALAGRPAVSLAKMLHEYLYITYTLKRTELPASRIWAEPYAEARSGWDYEPGVLTAEELAPAKQQSSLATVIPLRRHADGRRPG